MAHDAPVRGDLPTGTVTLLFTDIEGSTRLLGELGTAAYAVALAEHRQRLRQAFAEQGGIEVDTQGDSFLFAFPTAQGALDAARAGQDALDAGPIRVRMAVHTGTPELAEEGYVGADLHRGARIAEVAHGGQVLVSAVTAALVDGRGLRDLGVHRLRDLSLPERIYQAGEDDFPPLVTPYQTNLPLAATPFIGRQRETAEVVALLARDEVRLLTLTGTGGTGKTRLALAVAAQLAERYPDGVWWIPLAALHDPALVVEAAALALGARGDLAARIAGRRMLLVLDNFEQVIGAAPELARLLAGSPGLELLVTSRAALHVTAEHEYAVPPLVSRDAIELFIARAGAAGAGAAGADLAAELEADSTVAELCRRLDDLPLAIELAAARVKVMTVAQILARLDRRLPLLTGGARDQPERQQTLRATIDWSYDLLTPGEQELFARLAVFRGGCSLEAAETVALADLDTLQSLVDQNVLHRSNQRFVMLEAMLEFAAELLTGSSADELRRRHSDYYLALAEAAEPHLFSFSREWFDRLDDEHDNMRAALNRLEGSGDTQEALRLAGALQRFWIVRGHLAEGRRRLERLLSLDERPTAARGKALNGAALLALNTGEAGAARRLAGEALSLHRQLEDRWGTARSAFVLGSAHADEHDFERARELFEASVEGFSQLGDAHNVLFVTSNLSWACRELGDADRARVLDEQNLGRARELGNDSIVALSLAGLAMAAVEEERAADALRMLTETLEIDRDLGDVRRSVDDLCRLCRVLAVTGRPDLAARLLAGAEGLHAEIGASVSPDIAQLNRQTVELIRQQIGQPALAEAQAAGRRMTFEEAFRLALG